MTGLIIFVHLTVCFALILIVLLQSGKGASMGAMFGGAGNQTLFGNTGASTFLTKATTVAAVVFMITSLLLAYVTKDVGNSVVSGYKPAQQGSAPVHLPLNKGSQNVPSGAKQAMPSSAAPTANAPAAGKTAAPVATQGQTAPASQKNPAATGNTSPPPPPGSADANTK